MRIKSVRVDRYGPLGDFARQNLADFNLIYGANERGKTLMIDAVLKLLFKKELNRVAKTLGNIGRVLEQPEGFLVLETDGEEIKLERNETFSNRFGITATDFRNVFVVRDSDLRIDDEREYYSRVSERLSGLRTTEIEGIKKALQKAGRLTNPSSKSELSDSAPAEHIGSKVEQAGRLSEVIEERLAFLRNSDFDHLERALAETKERITVLEGEQTLLKEAELRERYREADENYRALREVMGSLSTLGGISDEGADRWADHDMESRRIRSELRGAEEQRTAKEKKLDAVSEELAKHGARGNDLDGRQRRFDDDLKPKIDIYEDLRKKHAVRRTNAGLWKWGTWTSLFLLVLSLTGGIVTDSILFLGFAAVFVVSLFVGVWRWIGARRAAADLNEAFEDIVRTAKSYNLRVETPRDLPGIRNPFDADIEAERRIIGDLEIERRMLDEHLSVLSRKIGDLNGRLREIDDAVSTLRTRCGLDTLDDYRSALRRKREKLSQQQTLRTMLGRLLGDAGGNEMQRWKGEISHHLTTAATAQSSMVYDGERATSVAAAIKDLRAKAAEIDHSLDIGRTELRDLERKIVQAEILPGESVVCRTTRDLEGLAEMLKSFVDRILVRKENALQALRIFEEIEHEERAKVVELFGVGNPVSGYFSQMTGGEYEEVCFNVETSEIRARNRRGDWLSAGQLSGGAFDQLYFATRLSIAQSMLGEGRGFFILDDPFIKADIARLKSQVQLLKRICASGWQIFYFSAKKEVLDTLRPDIAAGRVTRIDLDAAPEPFGPARTVDRPPAGPAIDLFSDSPVGD